MHRRPALATTASLLLLLPLATGCLRGGWGAVDDGDVGDGADDANISDQRPKDGAGGEAFGDLVAVEGPPQSGCGGFWTRAGNADGDDQVAGVTFDSKGRLVAAGQVLNVGTKHDLVVWRYLPDGTPDKSFSKDGQATLHMSPFELIAGLIPLPGGKLVVGGSVDYGTDDPTAWRFNEDGTVDTTFGKGGYARIPATGEVQGTGIAGDASTGYYLVGSQYDNHFVLGKLTPSGGIDGTFGTSGKTTFKAVPKSKALDVAVAPGGKVVVVGTARPGGANADNDMAVWRFGKAGVLDSSFGKQGQVYHDGAAGKSGSEDGAVGVTIDASGRIYVAGHSHNGKDKDLVVWRLRAVDGKLDPTFNKVGYRIHHNAAGGGGEDRGSGVILQGGKLLVVGASAVSGSGVGTKPAMTIWRLDTGGGLDTSFVGKGHFSHAGKGDGAGQTVAVGPKGQIVVGGSSQGDAAFWCLWPKSP